MSDGFNLDEALDSDSVTGAVKSFLGIQYEAKACDKCGAECVEGHTHDVHTAAYGPTPAWECTECGTEYYREDRTEAHTVDLYNPNK